MKKTFKSLLLSFAAMLFVVSAAAQVTTSSFVGHVTDKDGAVIGSQSFDVFDEARDSTGYVRAVLQ